MDTRVPWKLRRERIFISYRGWKRLSKSGELEDMELTAVRNDPKLLLDHFNCSFFIELIRHGFDSLIQSPIYTVRHDDTSKNWYFIMDFDLEYTDRTGITKILPRSLAAKNSLLRTVREATRKGGSGYIHDDSGAGLGATLTLLFDMCHAAAFFGKKPPSPLATFISQP
ncbi:hypothetical protein FRC00_011521 [Tulasnella sp. 408]|nr:hypothetical protein FRC00_011521 [Tulasnella sp. 408]